MVSEMDKKINDELDKAVEKFKRILDKKETASDKNILKHGPDIVGKEVIKKYSSVFKPENLDYLKREDFEAFLKFTENKHWTGLNRHSEWKANFNRVKTTLKCLLDEKIDIGERINKTLPEHSEHNIKGLNKGVLTSILFIVHPDKYCVWNNTTEKGMEKLGLCSNFPKGERFGETYKKINEICKKVSEKYKLSLWQVDWIWWVERKEK